jgi:DNA-binding CsgD family transcriptional regulator
MSHARLHLAALRGGDAEALIAASIRDATERGEGILVRHAEHAAAKLYAGLGRYDDSLIWARREVEHNPHAFYMTALPELVEAAVRCDELDEARRAADALFNKTQASGTAWARGVEARASAVITEGDGADALYREAITLLGGTRFVVESARTQLLYGEWLRRQNRRVDARQQLRAAHEAFATMGAGPFAERAERELKATGETVRKRSIETRDELTPQEAQIAHLAAERLTNAEIGAQLFLSPRTVEWHLRKVFLKLGISSRRELRSALPNGRAAALPA